MNETAAVLAKTRGEIVEIQKQMTQRFVKLAATIERLDGLMPPADTREFLIARCGVPESDIASCRKFSKRLSGFEEMLVERRVPLTVVKSLVSANATSRSIAMARIASGARFDASDLKAIKASVEDRSISPMQSAIKARRKALARLARNRAKTLVKDFEAGASELIDMIAAVPRSADVGTLSFKQSADIKRKAERIIPIFESAFGPTHARPSDPQWRKSKHYERVTGQVHALITRLAAPAKADCVASKIAARRDSLLRKLSNVAGNGDYVSMITPPARPRLLRSLPEKRLTALELCAGAGGMALGLEAAGFDHVALVEFDKNAAATMRLNRPHWPVITKDITTIDFTKYAGKVDLLCGGLPCQPYSEEGDGKGKTDARDLLLEGARAVREIRPKAFMFENVRGALFGKHSDQIAEFLKGLSEVGYEVQIVDVNTQDFGIAQNRPRIMFIGLMKNHRRHFEMPGVFPHRRANVGDVLYDLMAANGWSDVEAWADYCRTVTFELQDGTVVQGAQASTLTGRSGKAQEKAALRWAKNGLNPGGVPNEAPTNDYVKRYGGANFVPGLTLRMRARLQDFADSYEFVGGKESVAKQIGNAVAPKMAEAMGLAIYQALEGCNFDMEAMLWPDERGDNQRASIAPPPLDPILTNFIPEIA